MSSPTLIVERDRTPWLLASALVLGLVAQAAMPITSAPQIDTVERRTERLALPQVLSGAILPTVETSSIRSPFASDVSAPSALADSAPEGALSLVGLASDRSGSSVVVRTSAGATYSARRGESILGWRVVAAGAGRAVLTRDGKAQVLVLGARPAPARQARSEAE